MPDDGEEHPVSNMSEGEMRAYAREIVERGARNDAIDNIGNDEGVQVLWDLGIPFIHPALDFAKGNAYLTQPLLVTEYDEKNEKEEIRQRNFIISSTNGGYMMKLIESGKNNYEDYVLRIHPAIIDPRWEVADLNDFLKNPQSPTLRALYDEVLEQLIWYFDMPQDELEVIALWVVGTYFFPILRSFPYLYFNATKRSGKTKMLYFLSKLCFNAFLVQDPTQAAYFRLADNNRATLLIDEMENINSKEKAEIRSLLLGSYKEGIAVPRCEEKRGKGNVKELVVKNYFPFSPRALANIGGFDDVLEDRCITFILQRSSNPEITNREIADADIFQKLRNKLYRATLLHYKIIADANQNIFAPEISAIDPLLSDNAQIFELCKNNTKEQQTPENHPNLHTNDETEGKGGVREVSSIGGVGGAPRASVLSEGSVGSEGCFEKGQYARCIQDPYTSELASLVTLPTPPSPPIAKNDKNQSSLSLGDSDDKKNLVNSPTTISPVANKIEVYHSDVENNKTELSAREWELWKPLMVIAKAMDYDEHFVPHIEAAHFAKLREEEFESWDTTFIQTVMAHTGETLLTKQIAQEMSETLGLSKEETIKTRWVGKAAKRFAFQKVRHNNGVCIIATSDQVKRCCRALHIPFDPPDKKSETA